jgi:hypothetical protein
MCQVAAIGYRCRGRLPEPSLLGFTLRLKQRFPAWFKFRGDQAIAGINFLVPTPGQFGL